MTKTLTKKWKSGELECGEYYLKYTDGTTDREYLDWANVYGVAQEKGFSTEPCDIEEVLAPVPSYDQFVELTEKANQFSQLVKKVDELEKEKAELLEKIKQIEELFRYALFSDSGSHYKPCKNTTKQEAYNILGRIQEILGTNEHNGIYGREPDRV